MGAALPAGHGLCRVREVGRMIKIFLRQAGFDEILTEDLGKVTMGH